MPRGAPVFSFISLDFFLVKKYPELYSAELD